MFPTLQYTLLLDLLYVNRFVRYDELPKIVHSTITQAPYDVFWSVQDAIWLFWLFKLYFTSYIVIVLSNVTLSLLFATFYSLNISSI